jgi:rhamnosyltransferase
MTSSYQSLPLRLLGQSGFRLAFDDVVIYVDPYLSNSVEILHSADLVRQVPIPILPTNVNDADFVFITHDHTDHCDPHTIPQIAAASPRAKFICPHPVELKLNEWGIDSARIITAFENWVELIPGFRFLAVPAAHPEIARDSKGRLECVGFLIEISKHRIYIAGDTSVKQEIIDVLLEQAPIHTAFLPVNEKNYFKERREIIGNMSVREAFQLAEELNVKQMIAVHWDMFAVNSVTPEEIRLLYKATHPPFKLLINPTQISFNNIEVSIVIRTLNEARHLEELLKKIQLQITNGLNYEIVLVDSGSTDATLEIAERYGCNILHIARADFSFGRSLNVGCLEACGKILIFISGHCVPVDELWLQNLCQPILDGVAEYSYGHQLGGPDSYTSEKRIFAKFYPSISSIPQDGFFCNNANSALLKSTWEQFRFDEDLTGLEDMEIAQRLVLGGGRIAYVATASVFHYHYEEWAQVLRRFERESIALQKIMPQLHLTAFDALRYFVSSVWKDLLWSCNKDLNFKRVLEIIRYRRSQYLGSWKGNHQHRQLSRIEKEKYFFPH